MEQETIKLKNTISELISKLQEIKNQHGPDVEVDIYIYGDKGCKTVNLIELNHPSKWNPKTYITICADCDENDEPRY